MWVQISKKRLKQILGRIKTPEVQIQTGGIEGNAVVALMPTEAGDAFAIRGKPIIFTDSDAERRARDAGIILPGHMGRPQGVIG